MHVHSNPDLRLRAYDDIELMEAGIRVGARAIVIKTHQGTTMDRAYLCNRHNQIVHGGTNDFTMYGSITLNKVVLHYSVSVSPLPNARLTSVKSTDKNT